MQSNMNPSRRQLPPLPPHKRKERDETFDFLKPSRSTRPPPPPPKLAKPRPVAPRPIAPIKPFKAPVSPPVESPTNNNILLAGYLAHEYLHKGTLFGKLYDPAPPASPAVSSVGSKTMRQPSLDYGNRGKERAVEQELKPKNKRGHESELVKNQRYAGVSHLLKNGVHIPGMVNPSQLARFLNI